MHRASTPGATGLDRLPHPVQILRLTVRANPGRTAWPKDGGPGRSSFSPPGGVARSGRPAGIAAGLGSGAVAVAGGEGRRSAAGPGPDNFAGRDGRVGSEATCLGIREFHRCPRVTVRPPS
jgi:hypothetical protein